jgi:hypothetical protein
LRGATHQLPQQPRADDAEHKKRHAVGNHCHLKEAGEDSKMNNRLGSLSAICRAKSRTKTKETSR